MMSTPREDNTRAPVIASAPGRCGIIGNPTDMYGGSVLSCTIPQRGYVSIRPADRLTLESDQGVLAVRTRDDLQQRGDHFDVLRAVISQQQCLGMKAQFTCWSDVPIGSGLSSSSSLVVAALYALVAYQGRAMSRYFFAETARGIELNDMGVICGYQDFYMPTFGGLNYMEFRDKEFYREVHSEPYAAVESLTPLVRELPFVLAHTGVEHSADVVHRPIRERWLEGERHVVQAYVEIGRLAREGKKALLETDWELLGRLMNENHAIQRDLGGSGAENEQLIQAALDNGAPGAKLAGAGDGGTIIALHPDPEYLGSQLKSAGATRILFPRPVAGARLDSSAGADESAVASTYAGNVE
ncbi:MAG: hypothetical protein OXE05_07505 [Chloroflexi bacterium]|nr:hypothetical protein [Chloroflexota bacterium]